MRCEDLIRELASPTGVWNSVEMAEHLDACPACADRSRDAARFDRIWEATRPAEPSMDALDALWVRASAELDARKAPDTLKFERPSHRQWAKFAFVAQAAAVLALAGLVLFRLDPARTVEVVDAKPAVVNPLPPKPVEVAKVTEPVRFDVNVETDEQAFVHLDEQYKPRLVKQTVPYNPFATLPPDTLNDEIGAMEAADSSFGTVASNTIQ